MKKLFLLLLIILLVSCSDEKLNGVWVNEDGLTKISFENEMVDFFGVIGSYKTSKDKLILKFDESEIEFGYRLSDDYLILDIDGSKLILTKEE